MQINLTQQVAAIIQNQYEGGLNKFWEDGGIIEALPTEEDQIYVVHPGLPEALQKALVEFGSKIQTKVTVSNRMNFEGCDPDEVQEALAHLVEEDLRGKGNAKKCLFMITPVSLTLLIEGDLTAQDVEDIEDAIVSKIPGVVRGVIVTPNFTKMFEAAAHTKQTVVLNDRPVRDRPIGQDDLVNLKIALSGNVDVMDLIKNL